MINIDVLAPGHQNYDDANFIDSGYNSTEFYNSVVKAYNESMKVGQIAFIPMPEGVRPYNFKSVIFNRGAQDGLDLIMTVTAEDAAGRPLPAGEKMVKMKKLSATELRTVGKG